MHKLTANLSLKTRTTVFVVVAIGVLTALMATIQFRTSLSRIEQIEDDQAIERAARVVRQLDNAQTDVGGTNADWAWWDDSYTFVQDGNQDYRDSNLYAEAFVPLGIDMVVYLDSGGTVIHGAWYTDDGEVPVPDAVLEALAGENALTDFEADAKAEPGGIVASGPDLFIMTSRAVLPSEIEGDPEPVGVLAMGRHINDAYIANFAGLTGLDVTLEPCGLGSCAGLSVVPTIAKTSDQVETVMTVADIDGAAALRAEVSAPRRAYQESLAGIKRVLIILISVGVGAVIVTLAGLRRLIIRPVERLDATVAEVARTNDPSLRTSVERNDEIGELAAGVNVMLARLDNAQRQLNDAKRQVEGASEAKSRFLSRISHELRTPINGVLAYAQLLQLDHPDGESRESIEQIITSARHITGLVDEFLDIARIEAGAIPITIEPVNAASVAAEVIKMAQPLAEAQSTEVQLIGAKDVVVMADPLRLRQSVLNLVSNAIKYGHGEEPIAIRVESVGDRAAIEVRDHGPGIPSDQLDRLFVPFDRLDADRSDQMGSGVGLSVTKQLTELMNGTIDVISEVGTGTTFTIALPAQPQAGQEPAAAKPSRAGSSA